MSNPFPLEKDKLIEAYRTMKTIREFEERLHVCLLYTSDAADE